MELYDDFLMSPENFETMAKEFDKKAKGEILSVKKTSVNENDVKDLFKKIEFLRVLVVDLKSKTKNQEILVVLSDISNQIESQNNTLAEVFEDVATNNVGVQESAEEMAKMFCNNLKIAISTASDIVRLLIKIKDEDNSFVLAPKLTESTNVFLDINNQLVSLFGECRFLRF